jgi:hypothetical protein
MPATDCTSTEAKAAAARLRVLRLIEQAQSLLYEAAQTACPLQGWVKPWERIGAHADATKALWHRVNDARRPVGHD